MANILVVMSFLSPFLIICDSVEIKDVRLARNFGLIGRFIIERARLEEALRGLGLEGRVDLLTSEHYGCESGEISFGVQTFEGHSFQKDSKLVQLSTTAGFVGLPVVTQDGDHVLIILTYFTDAETPYGIPYLTNIDNVQFIDSIEIGIDHVILRNCDDLLNITYQRDELCVNNQTIAEDFDDVYGSAVSITSYPAPFDWGCDVLGEDVPFCRSLEPHMSDIVGSNGNVCTTTSTTKSKRCQANMAITSMTGIFRSMLMYLAETVPAKSFETEWIDREHGIGIAFPCL